MVSVSATILDVKQASDVALVHALAEGREDALGELYRRHAHYVKAAARRAVASADLADEAVQDAFLQLWCSPGRFDPERGSLRGYLQLQASRRAIDAGRAELSRRRREERHAQRNREVAPLVEDDVMARSAAGHLRGALAGLDPRQRQALELAYLEGHSYRQVAVLLGQPEGTVKNRIRGGLGRLRSRLRHVPVGPVSEIPFA